MRRWGGAAKRLAIKEQLFVINIFHSYGVSSHFLQNDYFRSRRLLFILAIRADPGEIPHNAVFYLGHHCLAKYLFTVIQNETGSGQSGHCYLQLWYLIISIPDLCTLTFFRSDDKNKINSTLSLSSYMRYFI